MHVCKATIQDYKKYISKILSVFLIFENFSSEQWQGFYEQNLNFSLFHKYLIKTIFSKIQKEFRSERFEPTKNGQRH
jgi:hypothetical protein